MRRDLGLPPGKAIAQGCHASVWAYQAVKARGDREIIKGWESDGGCTKIVLGVDSEQELVEVCDALLLARLEPRLVRDAGRTVLEPGTLTCLGVGPAEGAVIDSVTRGLKLY